MGRMEAWILLATLAGATACSPADDWEGNDVPVRPDADANGDGDADAPEDVRPEFDPDPGVDLPGDGTFDTVCDEIDFRIAMEPVRVMLLLDQSSSMSSVLGWGTSHWDEATAGLNHLLSDPVSRNFIYGLDAFPDGTVEYFESCYDECCANPICMPTQMMRCMGLASRCPRGCAVDLPPIVELGPSITSGPAISAYMALEVLPGTFTSTPLLKQMQWYRDTGPSVVPDFYDEAAGASYLVVISDGEDTCDAEGDPPDHGPVIAGLGEATRAILSTHGIKSFAIGFGDTDGSMAAELNAVAANGGTPYTSFFPIDDPTALVEAFDAIASTIVSCVYDIREPAATANPDEVNFYFDDEVVGYDEACTAGWRWTDAEHLQVEFCGASCDALKDGEVETISARFGCATILI